MDDCQCRNVSSTLGSRSKRLLQEVLHSNNSWHEIESSTYGVRLANGLERVLVKLQESAEMIAWIMDNEHTPGWNSVGRHLLISRDQDEIYLTFASYDQSYLKFLKRATKTTQRFLIMQEYGAWKIQRPTA
ncbi:hypothetical protein VTN77DRAFT_9885 [Rasamsonia byssochlamydoides]|uniref:uncharacterized protein n=1 Tax=Rasamsonia byssochlamydoides TaxID=89139 RepID=UPI003742D5F7